MRTYTLDTLLFDNKNQKDKQELNENDSCVDKNNGFNKERDDVTDIVTSSHTKKKHQKEEKKVKSC